MAHDHNHDHEERELITLVDEQGNETLFEILLTIDGKEEFGKNYVLLIPANAEEDKISLIRLSAMLICVSTVFTEIPRRSAICL